MLKCFILVASCFVAPLAAIPVTTADCVSYTLINTRGTGESQGESAGFKTMNSNILAQKQGGDIYNTVYPAGYNQDSSSGTQDILNKISSLLSQDAAHCIILQGYSQGSAATVNALSRIPSNQMNAIKGVFLIGSPEHKPNLSCNVDPNDSTSTASASGISYTGYNGIPTGWVSRSLDVCVSGDGVCDKASGYGVTAQHLSYPNSAPTQNLGTSWILNKLNG